MAYVGKIKTGKTIKGTDGSGAVVIVYYKDMAGPIFLMGQETTYLTESPHISKFKSKSINVAVWKHATVG